MIVYIAAVGLMAVMSCGGESMSGKKLREREAAEKAKKDSSHFEPQKEIDPGYSIGDDDTLQKRDIIVIPMSVSYSLPTRSWNLAFRINFKSGIAGNVKIDSTTASNIVNDHTIVAVRVYGQEVTLLRE